MTVENENLVSISHEDCISQGLHFYRQGDIAFSRVGDIRVGIIPDFGRDITISPNIIVARVKTELVNPFFLTAFMNCNLGFKQLERSLKTVAQPTISVDIIKNVLVPLFNVNKQEKIQKVLEKSFLKLEESEKLYAQAEVLLLEELGLKDLDLSPTLYYERSFSETQQAARLDAEFFMPKYDKAIQVLTCRGARSLAEVSELKKGHQAKTTEKPNGIPYASIKDISGFLIEPVEHTNEHSLVFLQPKGLALAITGATIGKVGINSTGGKIAVCGDLLSIHPYELPFGYMQIVLASPMIQSLCEKYTTGATNGHLSQSDVSHFPIPILTDKAIKAIHDLVVKAISDYNESRRLLEQAKQMVEDAVLGKES